MFIMLQSIEKNFSLVYEVLLEKKEEHLISRINRTHLQKLVKFLEPFFQLTCKFSSQTTETLADVWATVTDLTEWLNSTRNLLDLEADDDATEFSDLEQMKLNMISGLTSLAGRNHIRLTITDIHQIATTLDPRLKRLPFMDNDGKKMVYEKVISAMHLMANESVKKVTQASNGGSLSSTSSSAPCFGANRYYSFGAQSGNRENDMKQEFDSYLANHFAVGYTDEVLKSSDFPLLFWRQKGDQWPTLRSVARKYLAIPATSVPSEQIFSLASRMLTARRSMLGGKGLEMLVYCKKNIKEW